MWKHYPENNNAKDRVQWVDLDRVDRSKFYLDDWDDQEKYEVNHMETVSDKQNNQRLSQNYRSFWRSHIIHIFLHFLYFCLYV